MISSISCTQSFRPVVRYSFNALSSSIRFINIKVGDPVPVNFMKDGKDPVIKEDSEYPEWVFNYKLPTLAELKKKDFESLTLKELRRYTRLAFRKSIKEKNAERALGGY
mmetsp:Transcript_16928/g.24807  ORF Transcript_16928/g.24807 Transcript_16928/m.24807 type:complete len:109 (+) Transcript_16928:75-401(+)